MIAADPTTVMVKPHCVAEWHQRLRDRHRAHNDQPQRRVSVRAGTSRCRRSSPCHSRPIAGASSAAVIQFCRRSMDPGSNCRAPSGSRVAASTTGRFIALWRHRGRRRTSCVMGVLPSPRPSPASQARGLNTAVQAPSPTSPEGREGRHDSFSTNTLTCCRRRARPPRPVHCSRRNPATVVCRYRSSASPRQPRRLQCTRRKPIRPFCPTWSPPSGCQRDAANCPRSRSPSPPPPVLPRIARQRRCSARSSFSAMLMMPSLQARPPTPRPSERGGAGQKIDQPAQAGQVVHGGGNHPRAAALRGYPEILVRSRPSATAD